MAQQVATAHLTPFVDRELWNELFDNAWQPFENFVLQHVRNMCYKMYTDADHQATHIRQEDDVYDYTPIDLVDFETIYDNLPSTLTGYKALAFAEVVMESIIDPLEYAIGRFMTHHISDISDKENLIKDLLDFINDTFYELIMDPVYETMTVAHINDIVKGASLVHIGVN